MAYKALKDALEPKKLLASDLADSSLQKELTSSLGSIPDFSLTRAIQSNIDARLAPITGASDSEISLSENLSTEQLVDSLRGSDLAKGQVSSLLQSWQQGSDSSTGFSGVEASDAAWGDFGTRLEARAGDTATKSTNITAIEEYARAPQILQQQLLGWGLTDHGYGPEPNGSYLLNKNPLQQLLPVTSKMNVTASIDNFHDLHALIGMVCTVDGMVIYADSLGEGEPDGNGGGSSGGDGSGGSDSPITIPNVAWPNIIAGSFDSLDLFQPSIQNSYRDVDEEGDFTESMLPEPDMTLDGVHWVHIVEQIWISSDKWKFTEIVVMTFNVSAPSASGPGETTTVARNGFLKFRVDISRGFETSSSLGPKWTVDSDFKDKLTFNYQIGGGTTITPVSGGGSPAVTRTGADLANAGPSEDDLEPDQDGNSNWSASAKLVTMVSGDFNVSSVPISAPYSWTSSVREVTTKGEAKIELDVELGGNWSSSGSSGELSLGAGATAPATPPTSFPADSETAGVDGLDASTGEGFQSSASGSFETKLERDSALDWDLRGVKHDASILDVMGDVNSKLKDELKDKLKDNRFFVWKDSGVTPSGISWNAAVSFGWNLTPEVSASLDSKHGLEIYFDVEGNIAADEGDEEPPTAKRAATMKHSDYDFLNLRIKGEKSSSSDVDPQNTFEKSWSGEITIAYGLITTGDGVVDIKKAVTDLSVGGRSDLKWSFDGFDLVRVKIDSKDKSFHSSLTSDSNGTYLHSEDKDDFHKLDDKLRIKFDGKGELHAQKQSSGAILLSGTGGNKLVKHVDYKEESQAKLNELNKRWGGSNPDYWSRYIIWDDRTDKFKQTVTNENTFSATSGFTIVPQAAPVGDLLPIVSGFHRYGANPDGSDLTQASNPNAINWSLLNLATGEVTSTGATGSSQSTPATANTSTWVGWLQAGLDIAGLVPVIGEFADLANAGIYLAQGDYQMAGLSAISIIPVFGDAIGKSGKVALKVTRYMDEAAELSQQVVKKVDLPVLGCFVAGTPVHIASLAPAPWDLALCSVANEAASEYEWLFGQDQNDSRLYESTRSTQSIEEVTLGSRTVGENPNRDDYDLSFGQPDENTWRQVHMQLDREDGVVVDIKILRPIDWIEASGLYAGVEYHVDLPHTSAKGLARVLEIGPCPSLASGDGNLVIGRFETRDAKEVVKVTFEDGTTLTGTRIHPVWSLDREDWIELGKLEVSEKLQGSNGPVAVQCMTFIATSQPVYNLEIFGEHVYRVGIAGVLCHNTDPEVCTYILKPVAPTEAVETIFKAPQPGKGTHQLENGFHPKDFANGDQLAYFAKQRELAEDYARNYGDGILEVDIPRTLYDKRIKPLEKAYLSDPSLTEIPIPHSEFEILNSAIRRLTSE